WLSVTLGVGVATLLFAARLRNYMVFPLYTLSNLLEALREGDYSLRGTRARRGDAVGEVIWEVNALGQTLREQRLKVEEPLALLTKVLATIDIAIFAFDSTQRLRLINPAGQRLLATTSAAAQGKTAEELGLTDCLAVESATTLRRSFAAGAGAFEVRQATFREGGLPHDLLVINDLSRALREEERQAWQRLIRVIGHELNNSLAPIKSMAATVLDLVGRDPPPADWREDVHQGLSVIGDRAESLTRFMLGYTTLARLPAPTLRGIDLVVIARRVAKLEQRLAVTLEAPAQLRVEADPDQVEQALINLVKNAVDAAAPVGGGVGVRVEARGSNAVIEVVDQGPGLATSDNLFVPFFTTKPGGSGIGLVLARQIAEAHGGHVTLENRRVVPGCIARLTLPLP
ncbi:MAG TPA: ATP-binding protein, partial [Candidatus Saccharimonadia bacterium]|nr:ATP-binding protein [Candidatus Saccharimonadia bacterium]